MPSVCDCPYCGQPATIPEDLDSETVVRCPRCQYEFPGDRALMYAVEAPPEHIAELPLPLVPVRTAEEEAAVAPAELNEIQGPASQARTDVEPTSDADIQEPATDIEPSQAADEEATAPPSALPTAAMGESPPDEPSGANTVQPAPAVDQQPPEAGETPPTPVSPDTTAPESFCQPSFCQPSPAWRERRQRNPLRTAIGIVISGLLGLAVPYGAWLGLSKLGFWGRTKPPAAEAENAGPEGMSATPGSAQTPPPEPKSFDQWPGLDENRFAGGPKEVPKNVKPSPPRKRSAGGGQF